MNRGGEARSFFDGLWCDGDPWDLESSTYDRLRYDRQLELLSGDRYRRALEIGCGAGAFTARLGALVDSVLAVDVAENAIRRARARPLGPEVEFRVADAIELDPVEEGPFDLVVLSETIYYLGWLYSFFEVGWLAWRLFGAIEPGGRLLLGNTITDDAKGLESPLVIHTYRDLFVNVGFELEREEIFLGMRELHALLSLFKKP